MMKPINLLHLAAAVLCLAVFVAQSQKGLNAQSAAAAVQVGVTDIGGVVTGPKGPEAGIWVIAQTTDLPTKFAKVVVTDDQGRYLLPGLPRANYKVWARGYGLLDSPAVHSAPGKTVNLKSEDTPDARTAAGHYPAVYWYSMVKVPEESEFTDAARAEKGISNITTSQAQWLHIMKTD